MPPRPRRVKTIARWTFRGFAIIAIAVGLFVGWNRLHHNFGVVQPGRILRSGQMPASALSRAIHEHHVKTVLNLRGINKDDWYINERKATLDAGATQIDISMSSCIWMSRAQLRTVVQMLDTAEYPMLIHCQWGSERTGWVSAIAELLRPGGSIESARDQFSIGYLFVRFGDGKVMAEHLDQYEQWLAERDWTHHPDHFRRWVESGFQPQHPSREDWKTGDPYPLVVISTPDRRTR